MKNTSCNTIHLYKLKQIIVINPKKDKCHNRLFDQTSIPNMFDVQFKIVFDQRSKLFLKIALQIFSHLFIFLSIIYNALS